MLFKPKGQKKQKQPLKMEKSKEKKERILLFRHFSVIIAPIFFQ
jgi:hypothetical protein